MPTFTIHRLQRRDWLSLALILFAAALMRLSHAETVEFFHDEAMLSMLAQEMAEGLTFPTVGIVSSVGIPNPPTSVYVMALPYALSSDPLAATRFVALLNVLGVGLLWGIAARYFGPTVALLAGLAYALNPWAIMYSRKIWAQDFHTPFLLLALLLSLLGFREGRRWAQVLALPVMLFMAQIHFAAWALLPLYALLLWHGLRARRVDGRVMALSAVLSLLVMGPYLLGLAQTFSAQPDAVTVALSRTGADSGLNPTPDPLRFSAYMATGLGLETWVAPLDQAALLDAVPPLPLMWMLLELLALSGAVALWRSQRLHAAWITAWALLPVFVFLPGWTSVYPHYFVGAIPAWALLTALGADAMVHLTGRASWLEVAPSLSRALILSGVALLLLTQGLWWNGLMRYVDRTPIAIGPGTSGYTTPFRVLDRARDAVAAADDVLVLSARQAVAFDVEAARWPVLLRDSARCVRTLPADGTLLVQPAGDFVLLVTPDAGGSAVEAAYGPLRDARRIRARAGAYYAAALTPESLRLPTVPPLAAARTFANGVQLSGADWDAQAGTVRLAWSLPDAPSRLFYAARDYDYQVFVHLLDAAGERVAQADTRFWNGRHWCAGDRLLTTHAVGAERAAVTLRVGFYRLPTDPTAPIIPVDALDVAGNPAGQWVDLPLP